MPSGKFRNSSFIPALNALGALVAWLKPGPLAFRFGQLKHAIEPVAVHVEKTHQAMIDEHVLWDQEQPRDENDKRSPDERPRKRRTKIGDSGLPEFDFGQKAREFKDKYHELMNGETEISYTRLISEADIDKIEKERRETRAKGQIDVRDVLPPVDFSALIAFMEPEKPSAGEPAREAAAASERD